MKAMRIAAAAALVLAAVAFAGVAGPEQASGLADQEQARTITVTGLGSVETTPDQAEFSFGVERRAETAREAFSAVATAIRKVVEAAKGQGVAAADVQTEQISVSPAYTDDGRRIVGYTATSSVSVKLKDLNRAGGVIDAAVEAGANQVFGPSLTTSDSDAQYREALRDAVADARSKAQALATAAGVTLGRVVAVSEGGSVPPPVPVESGAVRADQAEIEPGRQDVDASVNVTFEVQ